MRDSNIHRSDHRINYKLIWAALILVVSIAAMPFAISTYTLTDFAVEPGNNEIFVFWETASETGNLGFYVWRSEDPDTGFEKLPLDSPAEQFIPSEDQGVGAFYDYLDTEVERGVVYYYKIQGVPDDGSLGEYSEVDSASLPSATPTSTTTPTSTPTQTPTSTPPLPKPDLQVEAVIVGPATPELGETIEVTVTAINAGQIDATTSFFLDVYVDHDPTGCDDFGWAYAFIPRLLAGEKYTTHFTHQGFNDSDSHSFYAQVDSGCTINENFEGNNIAGPVYAYVNGFRVYLPVLMKVASR